MDIERHPPGTLSEFAQATRVRELLAAATLMAGSEGAEAARPLIGEAHALTEKLTGDGLAEYGPLQMALAGLVASIGADGGMVVWRRRMHALMCALEGLPDDLWRSGYTPFKLARAAESVGLDQTMTARLERAASEDNAHAPILAVALTGLARRMALSGDLPQAHTLLEPAVALWRRVNTDTHGRYDARLADALNTMGAVLAALGELGAAVEACSEAERRLGQLASVHRVAHLGFWASSLHNAGGVMMRAGWAEAAFGSAKAAIRLRREMNQASAGAFADDLAESLSGGSITASAADQGALAIQWAREAAGLFRTLAEQRPAVFAPRLATALHNLGQEASRQGAGAEALIAFREEAEVLRGPAIVDAAARRALAEVSQNIATLLFGMGRIEEALAPAGAAVAAFEALRARDADLEVRLGSARALLAHLEELRQSHT